MSKSPSKVLQSLAAYLLAGQSALHPWSLDTVDANGNAPKLIATSTVFGHTVTINARFVESEFRFTLGIKIGLFDHNAADRNGNMMSITSRMSEADSYMLAAADWEVAILGAIKEVASRAFHLADDLKQISPRA